MNQKNLLNVLKVGIYLTFLSHFFVFKNLLFPYITSKQIYFNILVEILSIIWIILILKYPEWRPKLNWLTYSILAFFGVILVSCFTGVDFNLSFWGDVERMLGWFHLAHFLLVYMVIVTVFRSWDDWKNLLIVSVITAVLVSIHGIGQQFGIVYSPWGSGRIIATIGNAAYVGAYAIFNISFAAILFTDEKKWGIRSLYLAAMILIFLALFFSGTRGSYFGFFIGIAVSLLIVTILTKNKQFRTYSLISLASFVIILGSIFLFRDNKLIASNGYLFRMTHISLNDPTMNTRFISWNAAFKEFPEHPLLGTGYGNYAITFDRFFPPEFFNYTTGETYFDRAHNNIVDLLSTTGALGLAAYLSMFVFIMIYLIKAYRKDYAELQDIALVTGLLIAYFIQNLFVFDAMVTYIALMIVFAYVYWLHSGERQVKYAKEREMSTGKFYLAGIAGLFIIFVIYQGNIKPTMMLVGTIEAQNEFAKTKDIKATVDIYKQALSHNSVLDRDSRTTLHRLLGGADPSAFANSSKDDLDYIFNFTLDLADKNINYNPKDSMALLLASQNYFLAAGAYQKIDGIKSFEYQQKSMDLIDRSIDASPGRIPIYYYKGQMQLAMGEKDKALETFKYAYDLNPKYSDSSCQLAQVYLYMQDEEQGMHYMDECLDKGGANANLRSPDNIKALLARYEKNKDYERMMKLAQRLSELTPKDANVWVNLAKLYLQNGMPDKAKEAAAKVSEIDPSLQAAVDEFISQIDAGQATTSQ